MPEMWHPLFLDRKMIEKDMKKPDMGILLFEKSDENV